MYNETIQHIPMPARIRKLPISKKFRLPIPKFVDFVDGEPDFRMMNGKFLIRAVKEKLCWICGEPLGTFKTFVLGCMCTCTLISAEPPSHKDCATFAAKACPFLSRPKAVRREAGLPEEKNCAGIMIERNPGVVALWTTKKYTPFKASGGVLFNIGEPHEVLWLREGRAATYEEVLYSIETGYPILFEMALKEGEEACVALADMLAKALLRIPAPQTPSRVFNQMDDARHQYEK
jgi:hypothetical protein